MKNGQLIHANILGAGKRSDFASNSEQFRVKSLDRRTAAMEKWDFATKDMISCYSIGYADRSLIEYARNDSFVE
jgi:hypothetical protein